MFNPIAVRRVGEWTALISAIPNRRANAIYPLGPPPARLDHLLSLFAVHDRRIRCKVPLWVGDDVSASLASLQLRPVYGAHVMAKEIGDAEFGSDASIETTQRLDERWLAVNRGIPSEATGAYGAGGSAVIAARLDDVAVGLMVVSGGWGGIAAMYTHPSHRRRGLGARILTHLLSEGAARGAGKAFLQVVESNRPAVALYESFGFETVTAYDYWE